MRVRNVLITIYNRTTNDIKRIITDNDIFTYAIYQLEECPDTKRQHIQMYAELASQQSIKQVKERFNDKTIHIESRKGTQQQAIAYCSKTDTRLEPTITIGTPKQQGKRTDIIKIKEAVKAGIRLTEIIDDMEEPNFQSIRVAQILKTVYSNPRDSDNPPEVIWLYGKTGTGKTRWVYEFYKDIYTKPNNKWWDGYEQQETILIDDYRKDFCKFHEMLTLLDRYPTTREIKGGTVHINSKYIIFTSPYSPRRIWENRTYEDLEQLMRRINRIIHFKKAIKDKEIRYNITECHPEEDTKSEESFEESDEDSVTDKYD